MGKIFICTNDTMEMDLIINDIEEDLISETIDNISKEMENDPYVLIIDGNYIMGDITATYLRLQYGINCIAQTIE